VVFELETLAVDLWRFSSSSTPPGDVVVLLRIQTTRTSRAGIRIDIKSTFWIGVGSTLYKFEFGDTPGESLEM
jgi:hypothetical protein